MVLIVTIMSNNDNDDTLSPPAFSSVLAMPSRPKAWFDTQPTSSHGVLAQWLCCVRLQAQISILQCRLSTTMNNTSPIQPQRKKCQLAEKFQKPTLSTPWTFHPKPFSTNSRIGWWLDCMQALEMTLSSLCTGLEVRPPVFSLARLTDGENLAIRFSQPL